MVFYQVPINEELLGGNHDIIACLCDQIIGEGGMQIQANT